MTDQPKITQVLTPEKLLRILNLWAEFSNWRNQSPSQIVTGILEEEAGLMLNDTMGIVGTGIGALDPPRSYITLVVVGKRSGLNRVRVYGGGITLNQMSEPPSLSELSREEGDFDFTYYTMITQPVIEGAKILENLWPSELYTFVYGVDRKGSLSMNRKIYLCREKTTPDIVSNAVIMKTRYHETEPATIRCEIIWCKTGEVYGIDTPINKPFIPHLIKLDKELMI
jgi:hypothetical protein